jgi:hypothetical protein
MKANSTMHTPTLNKPSSMRLDDKYTLVARWRHMLGFGIGKAGMKMQCLRLCVQSRSMGSSGQRGI